jgi:alpha-L-fucosidase 2
MPDVTRRQAIQVGAVGAGGLLLPVPWTAANTVATALVGPPHGPWG